MMVAAKFGLSNRKVIVDYNGVQHPRATSAAMPTGPADGSSEAVAGQ